MCGIVGYVGDRPCRDLLLHGLQMLEYRGYDSAGLSLLVDGHVDSVRAVGHLSELNDAVDRRTNGGGPPEFDSTTGIAHTRWATHGGVTEDNAHPHFDTKDRVHIVLNGIVENHTELRKRLIDAGAEFTSETDAEVVAHLIAHHYEGDLVEAVRSAYNELARPLRVRRDDGRRARRAGRGAQGMPAGRRCGRGRAVPRIRDPGVPPGDAQRQARERRRDRRDPARAASSSSTHPAAPLERETIEVDWDTETAEKGGYDTFMLKEIHEQPDAVAETIADRTPGDRIELTDTGLSDELLASIRRIVIVACGTSYHAGLVGRYAIEEWARLPVEMDIASEYRYRNPVVGPDDLVIGISQSGETADTLAAMRLAREAGATVLAITNVMGSQATRDSDAVLFTRAGLEIGVAATKTFVSQVATMYLLGLKLATVRETLPGDEVARLIGDLKRLPHLMTELLERVDEPVQAVAERWKDTEFFLYLGRHVGLPVALEGALKLKEISYIPTDAYAAGEMKHGPIALLDKSTPVVCIATEMPILDKVLSNAAEVRARGAHVIAIGTDGTTGLDDQTDEVICIPKTDWLLQPILAIVPLQLLAYYIATARGLNVDKPRNLAKTVTVE